MSLPDRPLLRGLEIFPLGDEAEGRFGLRDPAGLAESVMLPLGAAILASLMNGRRTLAELQAAFQEQVGQPVPLTDVERLVSQLDRLHFLESARFDDYYRQQVQTYLDAPVRPAAHAGGAYAGEPAALETQLAQLFTHPDGPGAPSETNDPARNGRRLCGVLSPHIDLHRGGPTFAWAYKRVVEESDADLFIIFGTAHTGLSQLFSLSQKDFETPLGNVATDREFIDRLMSHYEELAGPGTSARLFADEMAHRHEHSIEFQAVFLQYLLAARRPFKIVPILTGSLRRFFDGEESPAEAEEMQSLFAALRRAVAEYSGQVCYISGGDLAHIGPRFGDRDLLTAARLKTLRQEDRTLLDHACRADAEDFFREIAAVDDPNRICGLAPTYAMLQAMQPTQGELLRYDQAVSADSTSCVSFASLAFYQQEPRDEV